MHPDSDKRGAIAWMTEHRVAPNLLMLVLIVGGLFMTTRIKQEVFPPFEVDMINVSVAYPGASPEQIEQGIVLPIEAAVQSIAGIKSMTSTATEGSGAVSLELINGVDKQELYQEIQQAIDAITTFPRDAERPRVSTTAWQRNVMDIVLYGDVSEQALRVAAEQVRDGLLQAPGVSSVELSGVREYEIHIDVDEGRLRAAGLSFAELADIIADNAAERSAGSITTVGGDLLLQVDERRDWAAEFADIIVVEGEGGALLRLGDIASLREGFEDSDRAAYYNGFPAVGVDVFRVGDQTPIAVSEAVRAALPYVIKDLPPNIEYVIEDDNSEVYRDRLELLLENAFIGLVLVLVLLSLFLEFKLAFWVTVGIPTAFLGALLFLPGMGVSINMISMFAFIIALGIVVDDAIVAGENIYEYRQRGMGTLQAAIQGARDIAVPITFSVLTNIVAFLPLAFIPGWFGQIWAVIPLVVGTVFAISLVEALFIMPAHLAHTRSTPSTGLGGRLHALQQRFSNGFRDFVERRYSPFLRLTMRHRYLTISLALGLLLLCVAYAMSGRMGFMLMPRIESDTAFATVELPYGSSQQHIQAVQKRLVEAGQRVLAENGGEQLGSGIYSRLRDTELEVRLYLAPSNERPLSTTQVANLWREAAGELAGVESLSFSADRRGPGGGAGLSLRLSHRDTDVLNRAAADLAERLGTVAGVAETDDGYSEGNPRWNFRLTESARALGLTASDIASQVRNAFYGVEVLKQLRGSNEVAVRARLAQDELPTESEIASLLIRTPAGTYVPLNEVAVIEPGRSLPRIIREDGRRTLTVTAEVVPMDQINRVMATVQSEIMPQLMADYPGLSQSLGGRQRDMQDTLQSFLYTVTLALGIMYALLAIPFRSYIQPAIIMISIPFGAVGALLGHLLMGYSLSIISIMGMIALGGVVVNDALVMIDYANARRREGYRPFDAIALAGVRRFRPIMLTTLTTFGGLAPMIFETSRQARFMIPMAISLGFGILFATAILLLLIPSLYMLIEDLRALVLGKPETEARAGALEGEVSEG